MAEMNAEGNKFESCLRQPWKVGDTFPVQESPSVEGMVAGTKWVHEVLMVIFVVPPFINTDGLHEKATLLMKPSASCSKQKLRFYDFSFPTHSRLKEEILQAAASYEALDEVITFMNRQCPPRRTSPPPVSSEPSSASSPLLKPSPQVQEAAVKPPVEEAVVSEPKEISDKASVQLALSLPDEPPSRLPPNIDADVITQIAHAVSRQLNLAPPPVHRAGYSPLLPSLLPSRCPPLPPLHASSAPFSSLLPSRCPPLPPLHTASAPFPSLQPAQDILHSPRRHRSASHSSGSRSSSRSSRSSHVRRTTHSSSSGIFLCPFSITDSRHFSHPQRRMKAKSEERKYLRRALHDLYSEFTTLKYFVDSLQVSLASVGTKPFASDLLWLQHHADYIDCLLLHMSQGPWVAWNELILDKLSRAFLELLIRVYPKRAYPDYIDESVRKWMKRKRIGISTQFGPIPAFLNDARVTDSGIQPKNGWDSGYTKDFNKKNDGAASASISKAKGSLPFTTEKK